MRSLSQELLDAQRSASAVPYLKVTIAERIGGIRRLAFQRLYTGSEPDGYHAATMPGNGSLLRARVDSGRLYYQRVTNPGPTSDFATWTDLGAVAGADIALCSEGANVLLFYVDSNGAAVKLRESSDYGASFGSPVTVASAQGVTWLAAGVKSNGDALLLYSVGGVVYAVKRSGGSWGSPAAWTNSAAAVSGLACNYAADFNIVVAGRDAAGDAYVWTAIYGDGYSQAPDTWSALREVMRASSGSSLTYRAPFLGRPDVFRLTFVEKYAGSQTYARPYHGYSPATVAYADNLWREPVPFDLTTEYGLAVAHSGTAAWLSTASGVWTATLDDGSIDVTADVLEVAAEDRPFGGRLRLVLRNDDGRYAPDTAPLAAGAEVRVSPGYVTAGGPQSSYGPAFWIDSVERVSGDGHATVVIHGSNGWALLAAYRARRQYAWAAGETSVFGILQFLFSRAGLEFSSSGGSSESANLYPAFTINPGESGLTAVRRLLTLLPDVIYLRGEFAFLKEPLSAEATSYAYGTDHTLLRGRYLASAAEANRAQVFGDGVFVERLDWPDVESVYDRISQVHDVNVTTVAQAEDRGDAVLRKAALTAENGEIAVPVNCGQELYDVIEVTDSGADLSAAKRRVLGIDLRFATGPRPAYEQRLKLGGA